MRRRSVLQDPGESAMAMASMIDIVFLLLIFFLCLPFRERDMQLAAHLPARGASRRLDPEDRERAMIPPVEVVIRNGGESGLFLVEGSRIPSELVGLAILRASGDLPQTPVVLRPAPDTDFAHVMRALDACAAHGMENVTFHGEARAWLSCARGNRAGSLSRTK